MAQVIKQLNKEELPWYVLTNIKQKIVNEQLRQNMKDSDNLSGHEGIPIEKFQEIFYSTVNVPIKKEIYDMLVKVISDETQMYLEYDKFMRLCDLFFFIPGKVYK